METFGQAKNSLSPVQDRGTREEEEDDKQKEEMTFKGGRDDFSKGQRGR